MINMLTIEWNIEVALKIMREEGVEEGRVEGREESLAKKALEIARRMLKRGVSVVEIAIDTDLSVEEINKLIEE